jgi:hypothetical protein
MIILPSLEIVPAKYNGSTLLSQIPIDGTGDFTVTRATSPTTGQSTRVNALGQIELVADNVPRLDYLQPDGTIGCPALLVEPAATNSIRNNSMVGAVAGSLPSSSGALPTNWGESLNGLVRQSVALGTENGVSYIDIRYSGTATGGSCAVLFETATQIVASTSQNWSNSVYLKIIAQPNPPIAYRLSMWEYNTSGTVFGGSFATAVVPTTTSLQRFTQTRALTGATTDRIRPLFDVSMTSGQSYDFTIRIGYPQMELGSVATSVIPTTTAAVTRNADVIRKTNIASLIGQSEGAVYFEVEVTEEPRARDFFTLDTSSNTVIQGFINSSRQITVQIQNAGPVVMTSLISSALSVGYHKFAFAYNAATNGCEMFIDGAQNPVASRTVTGAGLPALNNFSVGGFTTFAADRIKGRIRAAALYPTRLTNTQLALLTSPYTSYSSMASALSYTLG